MNNNTVMNEVVKSVGFCADSGEVLDDSVGLEEFAEFVFDEDSSSEVLVLKRMGKRLKRS
jgi:hypothetical protein